MAKDDDVSIFDELDDRLDDFFAEDDDLFLDEDDEFSEESHTTDEEDSSEGDDSTEDEDITSEDEDITAEDEDITAEDEDITAEDEDITAEDEDITSEDEDITSEDEDITSEDEDITAEDEDITSEDDITTEAVDNEIIVDESEDTEISQPSKKNDEFAAFNSKNPLHQLKVIVLEMDWEISDENLERYLSEIDSLIVNYRDDRPIYLFFKLHSAIGKYMLQKKARAHPEALKFLYGVYNSLENALSDGTPLVEKNKLLLGEVNNFKFLKKKLFPGFYPEENEQNIITETEISDDSALDEDEIESVSFDISALPDDIQNGINNYIEEMIAKKIESIK